MRISNCLVALPGPVRMAAAQASAGVPALKAPLAAPAAGGTPAGAGAARTIARQAPVPAGCHRSKDVRDITVPMLDDGDGRADERPMMMCQAWDSAAVNPEPVGQALRIPGFGVPAQDSREELNAFLRVPYFGACLHSPPPPVSQTVLALPEPRVKGVRATDTLWIGGRLGTGKTDTCMGASSHRIEATRMTPCGEAGR